MRRHDTDYAMMPPALRSNLDVPWDLRMEEYPKLWRNSIYTTWKAGSPGEEVGLAMTFISTNHREFDSGQLVLDISDGAAIWYPASKVDDNDDSNESTGNAVEDDNDEDDSDDDDLDEDLHKTVTDIWMKTYTKQQQTLPIRQMTLVSVAVLKITPRWSLYPAPGQPGWARCHRIH